MMLMARPVLAQLLLLLLTCGECLSAPLKVVTTTGMIGDTAKQIGGPLVEVTALMGEGVDPHLYKPAPGDIRLLSQADVVLFNGLHLEGRMGEVLEKLAPRQPVYSVTDAIDRASLRSPPEFEGNYDPHVWFDVALWSQVAQHITELLVKHLPNEHAQLTAQSAAYIAELTALDAWVRESIHSIPESSRVLVTAHDAFGYFGRAYQIEVLGIQGISTDSEASIREVSKLVSIIADRKVPAVFVESSVPQKTIQSLVEGAAARGWTVRIGGELFSDAMGAPGTPEGTYIGMVQHNVRLVSTALGGRMLKLSAPQHSGSNSADSIVRAS